MLVSITYAARRSHFHNLHGQTFPSEQLEPAPMRSIRSASSQYYVSLLVAQGMYSFAQGTKLDHC